MSAAPQAMAEQLAQAGAAAPSPAPSGSPMSEPTPAEGTNLAAHTSVATAMTLLQHALPSFGLGSREARSILECLKKLSNDFGTPTARELVPSQVMDMVRAVRSQGSAPVPQPQQ